MLEVRVEKKIKELKATTKAITKIRKMFLLNRNTNALAKTKQSSDKSPGRINQASIKIWWTTN